MPRIGETTAGDGKISPLWTDKTVTLLVGKTKKELKPKKYPCQVHGGFAVRSCVMEPDLWSLSHIKSGMRILSVKTEGEAKRIGEYLWRQFCLAFREGAKEGVEAKLPPWVVPWLRKINNETQAWIDPPQ